ncbi:MAG TPA: ATP-binding protein [Sphingomicrobium sp.]|nr:ATP-binding protein [Sphingomicrobium sp.]
MIALGRLMLCAVLLIAVSADHGEPHLAWVRTYSLLTVYAVAAGAIAFATWRNWWLDARLAVITHGVDMAVFTAIVFSANSTTSPFFLFFVLPLLSAAIRWSWRETAFTATVMILLYMAAGLLIAGTGSFELERFIIRAGNLLILSLLLIWFGIHQRRTNLFLRPEAFETMLGQRENPLALALGFALDQSRANAGAIIIGPEGEAPSDGLLLTSRECRGFSEDRPLISSLAPGAFLYDLRKNRALTREPEGRFRFLDASEVIANDEAQKFGMGEGLVAEIRTGTQQGWLVLWDVAELSADHIDLVRELGRAAGAVLDRHALLAAIESSAAARTRLSLARDVHDSIVQFLAGTAIRIEAIKRAAKGGAPVDEELDILKRLLVEEQGELRGFVTALRRDRELAVSEALAELHSLADRLSQQWSVECRLRTNAAKGSIPIRLQLDLQQLLREAVANAVRHGGAKNIDVALEVNDNHLLLDVADDGAGFPASDGTSVEPWSLKERVERANGSLRLVSTPGLTNISISLPLGAAA